LVDTVATATAYAYAVGSSGVGGINATNATAGGNSTWRTNVVVAAGGSPGGNGAGTSPGAVGPGGTTAGSTGTTTYKGGNGGAGRNSATGRGGPGGSSAGIGAAGTDQPATWSTEVATTGPELSGIGGDGAAATVGNGVSGTDPGGGGGGCSEGTTSTGGGGATGKIVVRYIPPCLHLLGVS
jgi:hypothetical protein